MAAFVMVEFSSLRVSQGFTTSQSVEPSRTLCTSAAGLAGHSGAAYQMHEKRRAGSLFLQTGSYIHRQTRGSKVAEISLHLEDSDFSQHRTGKDTKGPYQIKKNMECNTPRLRGWQFKDGISIVKEAAECQALCDIYGSSCAGFDVKVMGSHSLCVFHNGPITRPRMRIGVSCWIKT